ncbi:MAG: Rrf2 family transcriptional regulator [Magnetococcales bacterium]|nr:Rrf2 family transcriptional regulator [Magnetococcales bacterium]
MLAVNRMTEYATLVMVRLAAEPFRAKSANELAAEIPLAPTTLRKLLQMLASQRLLTSRKGRNGGFALARPAAEITLAQVMEAMNDPLVLIPCQESSGSCPLARICTPRPHWMRINQGIRALLENTTLTQMVADDKEGAP